MALTRKSLKAMGLTDEQVDSIIEMHIETVDGLKADVSKYKTDAEKLPGVQKELDELKAKGDDGWKDKHDKLKKEFDDYKTEQTGKETRATKEKAFREILKEINISDKRIDSIVKVTDFEKLELDGEKIKGADELKNSLKTEWADFVVNTDTKGANTHNPPNNNTSGTGKTKEEIMAIKDTATRQAEMLKNPDLFGI